ncbi:hypothetical protein BG003_011333 [Podila horticola]|nr:hypothetical protein BG003_011333 [Podila horticola]
MRIALISTFLAVTTAVVAHPGHSLSQTSSKHVLVRRKISGRSISALQAMPNLVARQEDPPTAASVICGLLKEEPLKGIVQVAITLLDEIQKDPEAAPEVKNLTDIFTIIINDIVQAGDQTLAKVKKSLTKEGGALGAEVVKSIETIVEDIETAVPTFMIEIAGCIEELSKKE